jgi:folate-dependent phosphoribosylglycinamide formyltransferase PurN
LQRCIAVRPDDSVHSLAERVFQEELIAYPEALRLHVRRHENG